MYTNTAIDRTYPIFIVNPSWSAARPHGFGTEMHVVLGPAAALLRSGTPTGGNSIRGIMTALDKRNPGRWIAGHLLNADLGGRGDDAENLAPLTRAANRAHATLEAKVKNACTVARQKQELQAKPPAFFYGVKYDIRAVDTFGPLPPFSHAPSHLHATCAVFKYNTDGTNERALDAHEAAWFANYVFHNVEVHNRDEDCA